MGVITIVEVLEHVEKFERMLADFYEKVSKQSTREGVRLLADYMSRHRQRIHGLLTKLPIETAERVHRICQTPLQYDPLDPHATDYRCFEDVKLSHDATAAEVLDAAIKFDECLVSLYRQIAKQPVDREVKELFENLIRFEQYDVIELKKIKAMDYF